MLKRSDTVVLAITGAACGTGWWLHRNDQDLLRNRYASLEDCACDYSTAACTMEGRDAWSSTWVGPWYLDDPALRRQDPQDPGPGHCPRRPGTGSFFGPRIGTEPGYRAGFGGTAYKGRPGG